jgi:hypothetical protein
MTTERRPKPTHYEFLGIAEDFPTEAIRALRSGWAKKHHPDSGSHPDAGLMSRINDACDVLGDAELRARYDAKLVAVRRASEQPSAAQRPPGSPATPARPASSPPRPRPDPPPGPTATRHHRRRVNVLRALTYVVPLMLAVVVAVALLHSSRGPTEDARADVQSVLDRYEQASRDKDATTLCDELYASSYVQQIAATGQPCEVAVRIALRDVRNLTLQVLSIDVDGDRAVAHVRGSAAGQVPADANYTLLREHGMWRILSDQLTA